MAKACAPGAAKGPGPARKSGSHPRAWVLRPVRQVKIALPGNRSRRISADWLPRRRATPRKRTMRATAAPAWPGLGGRAKTCTLHHCDDAAFCACIGGQRVGPGDHPGEGRCWRLLNRAGFAGSSSVGPPASWRLDIAPAQDAPNADGCLEGRTGGESASLTSPSRVTSRSTPLVQISK